MSIRGRHILEGIISLLCMAVAAAIVQLVERWISDRKQGVEPNLNPNR